MSIAVSRIKSKYVECFNLEKVVVSVHESLNIPTIRKAKIISEINSILNMILTDIEIIAYAEKITQDQLDEIFSEMYNTAY